MEDQSDTQVRLKCYFNKEIRVVVVGPGSSFQSLYHRLVKDYGFELSLRYEDVDGDLITLGSQNDLNELVTAFRGRSVAVHVQPKETTRASTVRDVLLTRTPGPAPAGQLQPLPTGLPRTRTPEKQRGGAPSSGRRKSQTEVLTPRIRWQRGELIGQGAYGRVYVGLNLDNGQLLAVKQIDASEVSAKELADLQNEVDTLRVLNHPNIVRYIGTERSEDTLSIFLEYVRGGSIRSLLERFGRLDESIIRVYTRQLLLGLEYLHRNGIAHRDIKGANVLVDSDGTIKLADFGASKRLSSKSMSLTASGTGIKGTPLWMAPEVIRSQQDSRGWRKADVWSLGCTVYEMAMGKPPFSEFDNPVTAMYHIACMESNPDMPDTLSPIGQDFLRQCLQRDPQARASVSTLLLHPFVASFGLLRGAAAGPAAAQLPSRPTTAGLPQGSQRQAGDVKRRSPVEKKLPILKIPTGEREKVARESKYVEGSEDDSSPAVHTGSFEIGDSSEDSIPSSIERSPRSGREYGNCGVNKFGVLDTIRVAPTDLPSLPPGMQLSLRDGGSKPRLLPPLSSRKNDEEDVTSQKDAIARRLSNVLDTASDSRTPMVSKETTPSSSPSPSPPPRQLGGPSAYPPRQQRSTPRGEATVAHPIEFEELKDPPTVMHTPVHTPRPDGEALTGKDDDGDDGNDQGTASYAPLRSPIGPHATTALRELPAARAPSRIPRPRTRVMSRAEEPEEAPETEDASRVVEPRRGRPNHSPVTVARQGKSSNGAQRKRSTSPRANGKEKKKTLTKKVSRRKNKKKTKKDPEPEPQDLNPPSTPIVSALHQADEPLPSTRSPSAEPTLGLAKPKASAAAKAKASRIRSAGRYRAMPHRLQGAGQNGLPSRRRTASATPTRGIGRAVTHRSRSPIGAEARASDRALGMGIRLHPPPGGSQEEEEEDDMQAAAGAAPNAANDTELVIDEEQSRWESSIESQPEEVPMADAVHVSPLKEHVHAPSPPMFKESAAEEVEDYNGASPAMMSPSSILSSASSLAYSPPKMSPPWHGPNGRMKRDALVISSLSHVEDSGLAPTPVVLNFQAGSTLHEEEDEESLYFESPARSIPVVMDVSGNESVPSDESAEEKPSLTAPPMAAAAEGKESKNSPAPPRAELVLRSIQGQVLRRIGGLGAQVISSVVTNLRGAAAATVFVGGVCSHGVVRVAFVQEGEETDRFSVRGKLKLTPSATTRKPKAAGTAPAASPKTSRGAHHPDLTMAVSGHRPVGASPSPRQGGRRSSFGEQVEGEEEDNPKKKQYTPTVLAAMAASTEPTTPSVILYCGTAQGIVLGWRLQLQGTAITQQPLKPLRGHRASVRTLDMCRVPGSSKEGAMRLISGSMDSTLRIWRCSSDSSASCVHVLKGHRGAITTSCLLPHGLLASGSVDQSVRVWDVASGRAVHVLRDLYSGVTCISGISPLPKHRRRASDADNETKTDTEEETQEGTPMLVAASKDGSMRQWSTAGASQGLDKGPKHVMCFTPPSAGATDVFLAAGESGGVVRVWSINDFEKLSSKLLHRGNVSVALRHPDNPSVMFSFGGQDGCIRCLDMGSSALVSWVPAFLNGKKGVEAECSAVGTASPSNPLEMQFRLPDPLPPALSSTPSGIGFLSAQWLDRRLVSLRKDGSLWVLS